MMPLSKPVIVTLALLIFMGSWNDLLLVVFLFTQQYFVRGVVLSGLKG